MDILFVDDGRHLERGPVPDRLPTVLPSCSTARLGTLCGMSSFVGHVLKRQVLRQVLHM